MRSRALTAGTVVITVIALCLLGLVLFITQAQPVKSDVSSAQPMVTPWQTTFIAGYESRLGDVDDDTANELIASAGILCTYLEQHKLSEAWTYGTDSLGMSSDQAVVVIEEAIRSHCPAYLPLLEADDQ